MDAPSHRIGLPHAGARLTVDLDALAGNYRLLRDKVKPPARCGAAIKADAYGLGLVHVARALAAAGCSDFFVAHIGEGLLARQCLPTSAAIYILNGLPRDAEADAEVAGLTPVLNSLSQVEAWSRRAQKHRRRLPAVLQIDSGMSRFGLSPDDALRLATRDGWRDLLDIRYIMSHLACADEPGHRANAEQLASFRAVTRLFRGIPTSLASSSGIFLGHDYHGHLARPGAALYGINPVPLQPNPMQPVVQLSARVVQKRTISVGGSVGYGMEFTAERPTALATLSIGYADGISRVLGRSGCAYFNQQALPIVGRVSMDSVVVAVPEPIAQMVDEESWLDIIGPDQSVDSLARAAGTIGYEVLTGLGVRLDRVYLQRPHEVLPPVLARN